MSEMKDNNSTPIEETPTENTDKQEEVKDTAEQQVEVKDAVAEQQETVAEKPQKADEKQEQTEEIKVEDKQEDAVQGADEIVELVATAPTEEIGQATDKTDVTPAPVDIADKDNEVTATKTEGLEGLESRKDSLSKEKGKNKNHIVFLSIAVVIILALVAVITFTGGSNSGKTITTKTATTTKAKTTSKVTVPKPKKVAPVMDEKKLTSEQKAVESATKSVFDASVQYEEKGDVNGFLSTLSKKAVTSATKTNLQQMYSYFTLNSDVISVQPVQLSKDKAVLRIKKKLSATKKPSATNAKVQFNTNVSIADITFVIENGKWVQSKKSYIDLIIYDDKGNQLQELKFDDQNRAIPVVHNQATTTNTATSTVK